jgi:hypothetical protein
MVFINLIISTITLNINGLNIPIKNRDYQNRSKTRPNYIERRMNYIIGE